MNFPLLKTFKVSPHTTSFLNRKVDEYKITHPSWSTDTNFDRSKGYQAKNLIEWDDKEFQEFSEVDIKNLISSHLGIDKSRVFYRWVHFLDYEKGGSMDYHVHVYNEDFVLFIYLKDCNSGGDTVFHLNCFNEEYMRRTQVSVKPRENDAAIFSSTLLHRGEYTEENKRIFIFGIRVDMTDGKEGDIIDKKVIQNNRENIS